MEQYGWISKFKTRHLVSGLFAIAICLVLVTIWLYYMAGTGEVKEEPTFLFQNIMICLYALVGSIILHHRPANHIGWLFMGIAFIFGMSGIAKEYSILGLILISGGLPGAGLAAWLQTWLNSMVFPIGFILLNLLFPEGYLLSKNWRLVLLLAVIAQIIMSIQEATRPGGIILWRWDTSILLPYRNPTGNAVLNWIFLRMEPFGWSMGLLCLLGSAFAPLQRYRKGSGVTRHQIKWLAFFWGVTLISLLGIGLILLLPVRLPGDLSEVIFALIFAGMVLANPLVVGMAILRYRLYDIDILIKRSILYSLLTTLLAFIYYSSILLFQQVFPADLQFVVVLSTLSIAALFSPLRRRLQDLIDRYFYRRRYDAQRTLNSFAATLREQTDLAQLEDSLLKVIQEAIQPETIWLWLSSSGGTDPKNRQEQKNKP